MRTMARGLCCALLLAGCEQPQPVWSSCDEARADANLIELPSVGLEDTVEVGTELPVLSRPQPANEPETLATQALAVACLLTEDEVNARPALLEWATQVTDDEHLPGTNDAFDIPLYVDLSRYTSTAELEISREPPEDTPLSEHDAETRATALLERFADHPGVQGVDAEVTGRRYSRTIISGGSSLTRLSAVYISLAIGRAHITAAPLAVHLDDRGHVYSVSLPLLRLQDTARTTRAAIAEAVADTVFLEKATAEVEAQLPGFVVSATSGILSYPIPLRGEEAELGWLSSYYARNPEGMAAPRPQPHRMSLSEADAPLEPL